MARDKNAGLSSLQVERGKLEILGLSTECSGEEYSTATRQDIRIPMAYLFFVGIGSG